MYVKVYDGTYALGLKLKVLIYTCTCIMALQSSIHKPKIVTEKMFLSCL